MNQNSEAPRLPEAFLDRMRLQLGSEFPAFLESSLSPRTYALRVNTARISCSEFEKIVPFPVEPVPWIPGGYFYPAHVSPSRCPLYQAGLYYLQDPGAMTPASLLPVKHGDLILDLCAAPGGKAVALGAALTGSGALIANDISSSRCKALLRNIELFGIRNSLILNEQPLRLAERFPEFFDCVLLDAPCSGEGMFRKEEALARDWSPEKSAALASLQKQLILTACRLLRPGGYLLYSTCTFSGDEDEGTVSYLLEQRPDMHLVPCGDYEGFSPGVPSLGNGDPSLVSCLRLYPHRLRAEGHFIALFRKDPGKEPGDAAGAPEQFSGVSGKAGKKKKTGASALSGNGGGADRRSKELIDCFFREIGLSSIGGEPLDESRLEIRQSSVYLVPQSLPYPAGVHFLRRGLFLGELKKDRFEPSQPFALALRKGECGAVISLSPGDPRLERYLKGEPITLSPEELPKAKGWALLSVLGYPLAFGKLTGGVLKNKYPPSWRV